MKKGKYMYEVEGTKCLSAEISFFCVQITLDELYDGISQNGRSHTRQSGTQYNRRLNYIQIVI